MSEPTTDHVARRTAVSPVRAYTVGALACAVVLGLTSLHANQAHRRALAELATAWGQAGQTVESEAKAAELAERIRAMSRDLEGLRRDHSSLGLSAVAATLVNRMPETAILDRLSLDVELQGGARVLRGDAVGTAPSLAEVESFAARLARTPPFDDVHVEERLAHGRALDGSVGFGLTFRVDLDATGPVPSATAAVPPRAGRGVR